MRILEIKNSLVKISYEVEDNLALSGFAIIEDVNTPYVAQVVNLKAENGRNFAVLKLLFTFNNEGVLKPYNGTIPSLNATITKLPSEELLAVLPMDNPIYLGLLAHQNAPFKFDSSVLQSNLLICSNNVDNSSKILSNILPQMVDEGKKVVLLDVNGDFASEENFIFGKNFQLPLNAKFLDYIFENDLDGVEPVSKAVIQDIFKEIKDYIETLPQGYLPLDLFINVVQQQYKETAIAELVLLKNKLLKYQEARVFASGNDDVEMFRSKVAHSDSLIVDVSVVDVKLQKLLIPYLFDCISTVNADTFVLITMNNEVADKKLLRKTLEFRNIYTTIICGHEFKYLPDLKQIIQNLILFAPQTLQHDFANYNTFLAKLNSDEFIVYGPATQQIPFIVQYKPYDELEELDRANQEAVHEDIVEEEQDTVEDVLPAALPVTEEDDAVEHEEPSIIDNEPSIVGMPEVEPVTLEDALTYSGDNIADEEFVADESAEFNDSDNELEIAVEAEDEATPFSDVENISLDINEPSEFEQEAIEEREALEEQVAKDVDAAFYTKFEEESLDTENDVNPEVLMDNDSDVELTDSDLDFIQSMPLEDNTQEIYSADDFIQDDLEVISTTDELETDVLSDDSIDDLNVDNSDVFTDETDSATDESQMVPIYTPEEFSETAEDAPLFESGDIVTHPKYGQGVVEKMINYGNKTLCSISFVNIGRRLLDPSLSELTLMSRGGVIVN